MPCNPSKPFVDGRQGTCKYEAPDPGPSGGCAAELTKDGCLPNNKAACEACATAHEKDLGRAGCTPTAVEALCSGSPSPPPAPGGCAAQFAKDACLPNTEADCDHCVHKHKSDLDAAGCASGEARKLCDGRR